MRDLIFSLLGAAVVAALAVVGGYALLQYLYPPVSYDDPLKHGRSFCLFCTAPSALAGRDHFILNDRRRIVPDNPDLPPIIQPLIVSSRSLPNPRPATVA